MNTPYMNGWEGWYVWSVHPNRAYEICYADPDRPDGWNVRWIDSWHEIGKGWDSPEDARETLSAAFESTDVIVHTDDLRALALAALARAALG